MESNGAAQHDTVLFPKPTELPDTNLKMIRWGVNENRRLIELRTRNCDKGVPPPLWILFALSGIYKFIMARVQRDRNNDDICLIQSFMKFKVQVSVGYIYSMY